MPSSARCRPTKRSTSCSTTTPLTSIPRGRLGDSVATMLGKRDELHCAGPRINPADRVLSPFGDPNGTVGPDDHAVRRRTGSQSDQIGLAGLGERVLRAAG